MKVWQIRKKRKQEGAHIWSQHRMSYYICTHTRIDFFTTKAELLRTAEYDLDDYNLYKLSFIYRTVMAQGI